jgi:sugar-specific transcriptional regulator TrmB
MEEDFLPFMVELGLTSSEARVYLAAVVLGAATTAEIAAAAGKERSNTHHLLQRLEQLGLVEATVDSPTKFKPIELGEAIDHLFSLGSVKFHELDERRKTMQARLSSQGLAAVRDVETYSVIKGRARTYLRMIESMSACEKEVSLLISANGVTRLRRFGGFMQVMKERARAGVEFRVITEISRSNVDDVRAFGKLAELRHVRNQSTNASVYDSKVGSVALVINDNLDEDAPEHVALWTNGGSFVKMLRDFFDSVWFVAAPASPTLKSMGLKP